MTPTELLTTADITRHVLTRPDIAKLLSQHPDANWSIEINPTVHPKVRISGDICLTSTRHELEVDITEIANSINAQNWNYIEFTTLVEDNEVRISTCTVVSQPLQPDEKALLKTLGHLRTVAPDMCPYEVVTCDHPQH